MQKLRGKFRWWAPVDRPNLTRDAPSERVPAPFEDWNIQKDQLFDSGSCILCKHFNLENDSIRIVALEYSANLGCRYCEAIVRALYAYAGDVACQTSDQLVLKYAPRACLTIDHLQGQDAEVILRRVSCLEDGIMLELSMLSMLGTKLQLLAAPTAKRRPFNLASACAISGDTASAACFEKLNSWISTCCKVHDVCNRVERHGALPRRLLDLSGTKSIKLTEKVSSKARFACLSHCWGSTVPLRTTSHNIHKHQRKIKWDMLPRTFQDAVFLSRKLGIQYLWIDSLCIVQDDASDWDQESAKMASIYRNAFITLAASRASHSSEGLFSKAPASNIGCTFTCESPDGIEAPLCIRRQPLHLPDADSAVNVETSKYHQYHPLATRGWAFQERLLSRRIVHFGHAEIVWECSRIAQCECSSFVEVESSRSWSKITYAGMFDGPKYAVRNAKNLVRSLRNPEHATTASRWQSLVQEYTWNKLTFEKDIFPAFSGMARHMSDKRKGGYLAGVWEDNILPDLLWRTPWMAKRPVQWRAPTWSWASVSAPVIYPLKTNPSVDLAANDEGFSTMEITNQDDNSQEESWVVRYATPISARCHNIGVDTFGQLSMAVLTIEGYLKRCVIGYETRGRRKRLFVPEYNLERCYVFLDVEPSPKTLVNTFGSVPATAVSPGMSFPDTALPLTTCLFKMVRTTQSRNEKSYECWFLLLDCKSVAKQEYERIGLVSVTVASAEDCENMFKNDGEFSTVTLV